MSSVEFSLSPADNQRLANLCGQLDEHLRQIERRLDVQISNRSGSFSVQGEAAERARDVLHALYRAAASEQLSPERVHLALQEAAATRTGGPAATSGDAAAVRTRKEQVRCRGTHQIQYIESIRSRDLTFGIGPAGTGKTYLAVACAVEALEAERVQRLVLVRPAVEAGERLGFLPGDLAQKVDPYLRPIYDALYDFLGFDRVGKLIERNVIEVAPLAYMRGRTLNHAFAIMDEAQNTTVEQMKMFLTRIGFGSTAVVTGDITQCDLPKRTLSGLRHVQHVLDGVEGIGFTRFDGRDVVRHPLVQRIVGAYERAEHDADGGPNGGGTNGSGDGGD